VLRQFPLLICCVLGACAAPISRDVPDTDAIATAPVTANAVTQVTAAQRAAATQAVRSFIAVIETVEPVAEAECRARAPRSNCDFRIVVDDRPGQLAGVIGGSNPDAIQAAQEFGAALGARSYSKDFELEADALGTVIAAKAGYNPLRGAEFFFRIPDPGNTFLGTHPANADRLAIVQRTAARFGY